VSLALTADVTVTSPAGGFTLLGRDSTLHVQLASIAQTRRLIRLADFDRTRRARALRLLDRGLRHGRLDVHVEIAGRVVAVLGDGAKPGIVSRLLGWAPLELRLGQLLRTAFTTRGGGAPQ
jgi:hypothetical protein